MAEIGKIQPVRAIISDVGFSIRRASGEVEKIDASAVIDSDDQAVNTLANIQEGDNADGIGS